MSKRIFVLLGQFYPNKYQVEQLLLTLDIQKVELIIVDDFNHIKKSFSYNNYKGNNVEAIFVGQVPHSSHGTLYRSLISDVSLAQSSVPVYRCTTKSGQLKATKCSLEKAFITHKESLTSVMESIEENPPNVLGPSVCIANWRFFLFKI